MELDDSKILDSLRDYVKKNPIKYWLEGKEITPSNFKMTIPIRPFRKGDFLGGYNYFVSGRCNFDWEGFQGKEFMFECTLYVDTCNFTETVKKVKDNSINLKKI